MITLLLSLFVLSAEAKAPTSVLQAAKVKLMQEGEYQPPFTSQSSTTRYGLTVNMTMTMHGWGKENVSCPTLGPGEVVTISYVVATNGLLPTMAVTANVMNERTGTIIQAGAIDVNMDGVIEAFTTMDGTDLSRQIALGQAIYDTGIVCFAAPQAITF